MILLVSEEDEVDDVAGGTAVWVWGGRGGVALCARTTILLLLFLP